MSSRALRRLRQEEEERKIAEQMAAIEDESGEDDEDDSDEDDDEDDSSDEDVRPQKAVFRADLLMGDDSDDDSSSSSEGEEISGGDGDEDEDDAPVRQERAKVAVSRKKGIPAEAIDEKEEEEEDIDAILNEFGTKVSTSTTKGPQKQSESASALLLKYLIVKHLDVDHVLRDMLGAHAVEQANQPIQNFHAPGANRGGRNAGASAASSAMAKRFLFGKPRPHWTRPPTHTGGGVGMKLLFENFFEESPGGSCNDDNQELSVPPPPYSTLLLDREHETENLPTWFTFAYSDTYQGLVTDFETTIQPTGDVNRLAMFVANHPFCIDSLLQLAMLFYHTGEMEKGNELLRRALYVYENAALSNFVEGIRHTKSTGSSLIPHMDATRPENRHFFVALFRLMQVAKRMGCVDTSFAVALLMLALDPHRDMMGMLCGFLDYFALGTVKMENVSFLVSLVESKKVRVRLSQWIPPTE
jgi:hypothetical protein